MNNVGKTVSQRKVDGQDRYNDVSNKRHVITKYSISKNELVAQKKC